MRNYKRASKVLLLILLSTCISFSVLGLIASASTVYQW